ncbi:Uncharacterized protein TCM_014889 [Theobroma cacao]|uniref:Uncharacterized protein n=1 Tax=Theobroma cacao TaxID=3641 RepID=A0A061G716_THECC|nr:Uncharacterized protein TCM_014889 [Theobroma cacao]
MRYLIGNDTYINFWDDKWIEGITLRIAFPRIFAFAINKSGKVCEFGLKVNGWDLLKILDIIRTRVAWWAKYKWPNENPTIPDIFSSPLTNLAADRRKVPKTLVKWELPASKMVQVQHGWSSTRGCMGYLGIGGY